MKSALKINGIITLLLSFIRVILKSNFSKSGTIKTIQSWFPNTKRISHIFTSMSIEGRNLPVTTHEMVACTKFIAL